MQLREWQAQFQQGVVQLEHVDDVFLEMLASGRADRRLQFDIYKNAYVSRLIEALLSNYPALHQLLGDSDFDQLGRSYLYQHPPAHASIRWFGDAMPEFLATNAPYSDLPVFSELSRFEWALRHTIDAADCDPVTASTLQAIAPQRWGELRFVLHPSATLLQLHWNATQVWQALMEEQDPPAPQQSETNWMIYRKADLVSSWRSVNDLEMGALQCLTDGGSFADICEVVAIVTPDEQHSAATSARLLRLWVDEGLIALRDTTPHEGA